jgi:hypothetical protein
MDEFYWHGRRISRETPMMPVYRTMQDVRHFLQSECSAEFKLGRSVMRWIADSTAKTASVADEWLRPRRTETNR